MKTVFIVLICIAAYLVGSVNFATLISRLKDKDIKHLGSGNPGTMNVMRSVGKWWGVATFVLDSLKGCAFALIGKYLINGNANYSMAILFGIFVIVGHIFPIFDKFRGGKGVASSIGVYIAISPIAGVITLVGLIIFLFGIKYGFLGSFLAITVYAIHTIWLCQDVWWAIMLVCIWWALVIFAHRGNIIRLIKGEENTLSLLKKNEVKVLEENNIKEEEK